MVKPGLNKLGSKFKSTKQIQRDRKTTITAKKEKEFHSTKNMIKVNPKKNTNKKPSNKEVKKKKKKKIIQIKLQKSQVNLKKCLMLILIKQKLEKETIAAKKELLK